MEETKRFFLTVVLVWGNVSSVGAVHPAVEEQSCMDLVTGTVRWERE